MRRYEKYKRTEGELIPELPAEWSSMRLKHVLAGKLTYGANELAEFEVRTDPRYIRITDFGDDGKLREETFKSLPMNVAKDYLLNNGDILFARSGATVGKTFQFKNYDGIACYAGYLIKATPDPKKTLSDFLYYFTKSGQYENWKNAIFNQATIQNIGADKYGQLEIPVPPLQEQTAIANYLDEKTAQINMLIEKKQKLIELLKEERKAIISELISKGLNPKVKFKPVPDQSEVPVHWTISRIVYISRVVRGASPRPAGDPQYFNGDHTPWITVGEVTKDEDKFITDVSEYLTEEGAKQSRYIDSGTLLLSNSGATLGVPKILKIGGCINDGSVAFLNLSNKVSIEFLYYFFKSMTEVYRDQMKGYGQPNLNTDIVKSTQFWYPSIEEQTEIVKAIEIRVNEIATAISKVANEINLLIEYKTALISEVVTGKVKVI